MNFCPAQSFSSLPLLPGPSPSNFFHAFPIKTPLTTPPANRYFAVRPKWVKTPITSETRGSVLGLDLGMYKRLSKYRFSYANML